jgi:transposase InsO family protein
MLTVIDEFSRECLAIEVSRRLRSDDVLQVLADLMVHHGPPD